MNQAHQIPLKTIRRQLLLDRTTTGVTWCRSYTAAVDSWMIDIFSRSVGNHFAGLSLLAIGGYGRRELYPYSDLDILLVHRQNLGIAKIADTLWYPIWDEGIKLDHAVRTPEMVVATARDNPRVLLGLLDARHLAGDRHLSRKVIESVRQLWIDNAPAILPGITSELTTRHDRFGDLAFLLEPDLKESRGGLRDIATLSCLARSDTDLLAAVNMDRVQEAHTLLAKVRVELHRMSSRPGDCLRLQDQEQIATSLAAGSADELMSAMADGGRVTATNLDALMRRMNVPEPPYNRHRINLFALHPIGKSRAHSTATNTRTMLEPIETGISLSSMISGTGFRYREIVLEAQRISRLDQGAGNPRVADTTGAAGTNTSNPAGTGFDANYDASLPFRVAAVSAERSIPLSLNTIKTISSMLPPADWVWPESVLKAWMRLLQAGPEAIAVLEILDQENIISNYIPGWSVVRNLRQHNAYHKYTVDRHLLETAVRAAMACPDNAGDDARHVLVAAALLHDMGKGMPGDHSVNGARLARCTAIRMGFTEPAVSVIVTLVRHHLLLPHLATRRDIHDPVTSEKVIIAFPEPHILELAEILAKADGEATGPLAWGPWKEGLVHDLVLHTRSLMGATTRDIKVTSMKAKASTATLPDGNAFISLARGYRTGQDARGTNIAFIEDPPANRVMVRTPDVPGVLSAVAGVFALHGIDIRSADISSVGGTAIDSFAVEMRIGDWPDWNGIAVEIGKALKGELPLNDMILAREQVYNSAFAKRSIPGGYGGKDTRVEIDTEASAAYSVLEVHTSDSIGLLYRLTRVLFDFGMDIARARVSTIGSQVVDAFYIGNEQLKAAMRGDSLKDHLENALLEAASPLSGQNDQGDE
ncbi:MAG: ACT domain-containing protein [Actinobacteria bacterium]|nr:ACT domain-containing protein [Actinomycetota bacterium]MCL5446067.1 ACT domain-containing protein [Actinomycetota bacterium]